MGNCRLNVRFSKPESILFLLIHILEKLMVFTLSVFTMKVYVSGINERFNSFSFSIFRYC